MKLWLKLLLLVTFAAPMGLVLAMIWLISGSRLAFEGQQTVRGLENQVEIRFDAYARPYVNAHSLEDAMFAQGFLHARERLWQMDLLRRAGRARLSELLGPVTLPTDKALWRAGVVELGQRLADNASAELLSLVDAYAAGVNAGIDAMRQPPPEYLLLRTQPAAWTVADSFALGALMAFDSDGNHRQEMLRLALSERLDAERLALFHVESERDPDFPYVWTPEQADAEAEGQSSERLDPSVSPINARADSNLLSYLHATAPEHRPTGAAIRLGSNGWAVAPERSASGKALFAFDSHDAAGLPNLFYEVHLFFGEGKQLRGWSVPGLPLLINGFNRHLAWGFTNIGDSQDLVQLTAEPDHAGRFFDGEDWYQATRETTRIPVRNGEDVEVERWLTIHGPVITDDPPLALRWIGQELGKAGMDALLDMNLAENADEFRTAMAQFPMPVSNVTWADTEGNIGFRTIGMLPDRRLGNGQTAVADDGQDIWNGIVPASAMPALNNPLQGFVAAANARVHDQRWPWLVGHDNAPGYRIRRIVEILSDSIEHDSANMKALQVDRHNVQARLRLPQLLDGLEEAVADGRPLDAVEFEALKLLEAWGDAPENLGESGAALLFEYWYLALADTLFRDRLGQALYRELLGHNYLVNHALDSLLDEPGSLWWRGARSQLIAESFANAVARLAGEQGAEPSRWRLDRRQSLSLRHALTSSAPGLSRLLDRGPWPASGGHATVGRAGFSYARPFAVTHIATVRTVLEMSEPMTGWSIIPGGQSGRFYSSHYNDQSQAWLEGLQFPLAASPDEVGARGLWLLPLRDGGE